MPEIDELLAQEKRLIAQRQEQARPWWTTSSTQEDEWEWCLWRKDLYPPMARLSASRRFPFLMARLLIGGGDGEQLSFSAACPGLGYVNLSLAHLPIPHWVTHELVKTHWNGLPLSPDQWWRKPRQREFYIGLTGNESGTLVTGDHYLCINVWAPQWDSPSRWWQRICLDPLAWLFGPLQYHSEPVTREQRTILLAGEEYSLDIHITQDSWKRPRWPRALTVYRANVEVPEPGIPTGEPPKFNCERRFTSLCFPLKEDGGLPTNPIPIVLRKVRESARGHLQNVLLSEVTAVVNVFLCSLTADDMGGTWTDIDVLGVSLNNDGVLRIFITESPQAEDIKNMVLHRVREWLSDMDADHLVEQVEVYTECR